MTRFEGRADDSMCRIVYSPNNVTLLFAVQRGGVGDGGEIFADLLRVGVVAFEFYPLSLRRQSHQFLKLGLKFRRRHGRSSFMEGNSRLWTRTLPVMRWWRRDWKRVLWASRRASSAASFVSTASNCAA